MSQANITQSIADDSSKVNDSLNNLNDSSKNDMRSNQNLQTETLEFDWQFYLDLYPDLAVLSDEEQAHKHWSSLGQKEGRIGNKSQFAEICLKNLPENFNWQEYLVLNPDLQSLIQNELQAIAHFVMIGRTEGRVFTDERQKFDAQFYLELYSDLENICIIENAYEHWLKLGKKEGRVGSKKEFQEKYQVQEKLPKDFVWSEYLRLNSDLQVSLKNELQAIVHFLTIGIAENRIYIDDKTTFDPKFYLELYSDLEGLWTEENVYEHWQKSGQKEDRVSNWVEFKNKYSVREKLPKDFDWQKYLELNPDLQLTIKNELQAILHFITLGIFEKREYVNDKINSIFDKYEKKHNNCNLIIYGWVDEFIGGNIWGWAKDMNDKNKHLPISIYIDNKKINSCIANRHRQDLEKMDIGSVECGFKFTVPDQWLDGKYHIIQIFLNDGNNDIPIMNGEPKKSLFLPEKPNFNNLPWRYTGYTLSHRKVLDCYFRIVFVSHMSNMTGAPIALLSLVKEMSKLPDFDCRVVLNEDGPLASEFASFAPTIFLHDIHKNTTSRSDAIKTLASYIAVEDKRTVAICNTITTIDYMECFSLYNIPVLPWIHELSTSINIYGGQLTVDKISNIAPTILTPCEMVKQTLIDCYAVSPAQVVRHYYGTYATRDLLSLEKARIMVREEFGLPNNSLIVFGCGTLDTRKGGDLFVKVCQKTLENAPPNVWFIWVGNMYDDNFARWCQHDAKMLGIDDHLIIAGMRRDTTSYFQAADIFALTSREDPFPLVNMEAMAHGLPVVAFEGGGGVPEVLKEGRGIVVPYLDTIAMSDAISSLLFNENKRMEIGERAANYMQNEFTWSRFKDNIVEELRRRYGYYQRKVFSVSVIIPNYNHAEYLPQRIESILNQTRLPEEIIFIDDASTDDSVAIAKYYATKSPIPFRIIQSDQNSGSTFKQWLKGFSLVTSELVWIAESDDWCEISFLERLIPEFYDQDVKLAFCQSVIAGPKGEIYAKDYTTYTDDISETRWLSHYCVSFAEEVAVALSQKNTIPNASAVIFRRPDLSSVTPSLLKYQLCGDWWFYLWRIQDGKISFIPKSLNYHRRHSKTVTHNIEKDDRSIEEALLIKAELFEGGEIPLNSICRSLALTFYEYYRLSHLHKLRRPEIMENPYMESLISRLRCHFDLLTESKGLRILIILPDMEVGGGQIAAIRLANAMAADNTVFLLNARPDHYDSSMEERIDSRVLLLEGSLSSSVWTNDIEEGVSTDNNLAEGNARLSVLTNLIKFHKIEVIHSHVWWADRLGFHLSKVLNIVWIMHMHGSYEDILNEPKAYPEFRELLKLMMQRVDGVIYLSPKNLEVFNIYPEIRPDKILRIFNGFDTKQIQDISITQSYKKNGTVKFCLCSRAIPEKGWEEAINSVLAINKLPAQKRGNLTAHLSLIGEGPFAENLRDKFKSIDFIKFHGKLTEPLKVIKDCDVGLLPSHFVSESLPYAIIEYLACGLPVLATDAGSIPEMLRVGDIEAGLILPLSPQQTIDVDKLTSLLLRYMVDDELFDLHRTNTKKVFESLFEMNKIKYDTIEFYKSLIFNKLVNKNT